MLDDVALNIAPGISAYGQYPPGAGTGPLAANGRSMDNVQVPGPYLFFFLLSVACLDRSGLAPLDEKQTAVRDGLDDHHMPVVFPSLHFTAYLVQKLVNRRISSASRK